MKECYLYDKQKNKIVKCNACSHRCTIADGKVGICGVRKNIDGKLYSLVYGKTAAFNIDPIEKKPLFHFMPNTKILSFGTVGCNFRCSFCQNWEISQAPREAARNGRDGIFGEEMSPEEIVNMAVKNNCPSIAYTYNEPAIFIEYAFDTAKLAHETKLTDAKTNTANGDAMDIIKNIYVSNGYETKEALELMKPYIDAMNIDLKSFSEEFYKEVCGAKLAPVLETIKRAHDLGFWIEITTLIIPGKNDSEKELTKIAEFIASIDKNIPWHVSRFFPMYQMLEVIPTPEKTLLKAYDIGKKAGLNYVYVGNLLLDSKENTYCPKCNELLIKRHGFAIMENKLVKESAKSKSKDTCPKCKTKIAGVF
ncbi:AmmeMemoRadiSam system radical SAM enzyme [Candidatus Woesearchaeota archaeon]|nr:AmmeMemoRadiSam system radical SAM enzyme [Candidatus Woesearchaeota archaeon]